MKLFSVTKPFNAWKDINATAYILGVYLGDGGVSTKNGEWAAFQVTAVDIDFLEVIQEMLFRIFEETAEIKLKHKAVNENSRDQYHIRMSSSRLCTWLVGQTGKKDHLPVFVTQRSAEVKRHFLQGLMDSEGCISRRKTNERGTIYKSSNIQFAVISEWIVGVREMFHEIGVETSPISVSDGCYRFRMNPQKYLSGGMTFSIQRKLEILLEETAPRERKEMVPNPNRRKTKPVHSKNISANDVLEIRRMYSDGFSAREISEKTGKNYWAVIRIVKRRTFSHIK